MEYFENNRMVNFEDLAKVVNSDGKRVYPEGLLQEVKNGNFNCLYQINLADRNNEYFMEPLLYAVKNERGTYEVYKYYGEVIQEDLGLAIEIAIDEPAVLQGTAISSNKEFMLDLVEINPKVIFYVSEDLKRDPEFREELAELRDSGIDRCIKLQENPGLAKDPEFMREAIKEDPKMLEFASEELKNDYNFIREASKENYGVIEHIVSKKEDFGIEAIKGAKETSREITTEDYMAIIDEMSENSEDDRYRRVKAKVAERGADDPRAIRWITAMVAQSDDISPENFKKVFDNAILTMEKNQRELNAQGNDSVTIDSMQELITPQILRKLEARAREQGLEVDEELEGKIAEYTEAFNSYREILNANKARAREQGLRITPSQVEEKTEDARISEINESTQTIRDEYTKEMEEKEVENENKGTDERS